MMPENLIADWLPIEANRTIEQLRIKMMICSDITHIIQEKISDLSTAPYDDTNPESKKLSHSISFISTLVCEIELKCQRLMQEAEKEIESKHVDRLIKINTALYKMLLLEQALRLVLTPTKNSRELLERTLESSNCSFWSTTVSLCKRVCQQDTFNNIEAFFKVNEPHPIQQLNTTPYESDADREDSLEMSAYSPVDGTSSTGHDHQTNMKKSDSSVSFFNQPPPAPKEGNQYFLESESIKGNTTPLTPPCIPLKEDRGFST